MKTLYDNQKVKIACYPYMKFTVGTIEGMAVRDGRDVIEELERNADMAKKNKFREYAIAWLNPDCAVISSYQHHRDQIAKEFAEADRTVLNIGE